MRRWPTRLACACNSRNAEASPFSARTRAVERIVQPLPFPRDFRFPCAQPR